MDRLERRHERALVGRPGDGQHRRRPEDARSSRRPATLSIRHLDLSPILNDADTEERHHCRCHARSARGTRSLTSIRSAGTVSLDAPRIVAAGFAADRVKAKARIDGRRVALDGRASAYGATVTTAGRLVLPEESIGSGGVRRARSGSARGPAASAAVAERSRCSDGRQRRLPRRGNRRSRRDRSNVGSARTWDPALAGLRAICASRRRRSRAQRSQAAAPPDSRSTAAASRTRPMRRSTTSICSASATEFRVPALADRPLQELDQRPHRRERQRDNADARPWPGEMNAHGERHAARHGDHGRPDSAAGVRCRSCSRTPRT